MSSNFEWVDRGEIIEGTADISGPTNLCHARNGDEHITVFESTQKETEWLTVPTSLWVEVNQYE